MPFWSGRAALYAARGLPYGVTIPKEGTIALANCSAVPVGAANKTLAFAFLNFRLDPDIQKAFCEAYFASPGPPRHRRVRARLRRHADHHRGEDGHDGVSGRPVHRPEAARLDAAMAGHHVHLRACSRLHLRRPSDRRAFSNRLQIDGVTSKGQGRCLWTPSKAKPLKSSCFLITSWIPKAGGHLMAANPAKILVSKGPRPLAGPGQSPGLRFLSIP